MSQFIWYKSSDNSYTAFIDGEKVAATVEGDIRNPLRDTISYQVDVYGQSHGFYDTLETAKENAERLWHLANLGQFPSNPQPLAPVGTPAPQLHWHEATATRWEAHVGPQALRICVCHYEVYESGLHGTWILTGEQIICREVATVRGTLECLWRSLWELAQVPK